MDKIIYYKVLEYLDIYNLIKNDNIQLFNLDFNTFLKVINKTNKIEIKNSIQKNKKYYSNNVIKEYNRIFLSTSKKILQSNMSIKYLINNYKIYYIIKDINKEIKNKFYMNGRDKILQSRLSIKDIILLGEYNFDPCILKYFFRDIDYINSNNLLQLFT
jgi:hypothetical protein